jgi:LysR family glycine cleavage system transcriptional activator
VRVLPPLRAFQMFEAAADHESFSSAAEALCVTHSAVSHQVRSLEAWLGRELFVRHNGGVRLTQDGERMKRACTAALSRLEEECACIRAPEPDRKLTIGCSASFLSHWLLPRVESFSAQHPEIVLSFQTRTDATTLLAQRIDALIVGDDVPLSATIDATPLGKDIIGPVCAPNWPNPPGSPQEIGGLPLLHATSRLNAWNEWAATVGVSFNPGDGQTFDSLALTIAAARGGLGFAVAPESLVRLDLQEGRLIAPLGFSQVERSTYLFTNASRRLHRDIAAFRNWLLAESVPP